MQGASDTGGRPTVHGLTPARHRVLRAIVDYWDEHKFSPSSIDLSRIVDTTEANVWQQLKRLHRDGLIDKTPRVPRSIVVRDEGRAALRQYETGHQPIKGE